MLLVDFLTFYNKTGELSWIDNEFLRSLSGNVQ